MVWGTVVITTFCTLAHVASIFFSEKFCYDSMKIHIKKSNSCLKDLIYYLVSTMLGLLIRFSMSFLVLLCSARYVMHISITWLLSIHVCYILITPTDVQVVAIHIVNL